MASIKFPRAEFEKEIKLTNEVKEKINLFGTHLENVTENEIEIEIFPNRPDLLSLRGFLRSFKSFLGKEKEIKYEVKKPEKEHKVVIENSVKSVRPFTACAIVKGILFDDEKIKEIIDFQEKLHATLGRNRKKIAIGIYPLEKIKLPITYTAIPPEKIKFIPLESEREMSGDEILKKHPTGKTYAHLLEGKKSYPVFVDANSKILSMPPIINSAETGKITDETKDVFIECSGSDFLVLKKTLNIIVTSLAEMSGKIHQMNLVYDGKETLTPDLTPAKMKFSVENANKLLGTNLKEKDLQKLFKKMGCDYRNKTVFVPSWRVDILHEVDLIEDIAIAFGYDNFAPKIPNFSTVGKESAESKMKSKISEILLGLGIVENMSYHLVKKDELNILKTEEKIEVENSKTDYKFLRPNLFIPSMRILSENKDNDYPQNTFEIGTVFSVDKEKKSETGIKEKENLVVACAPGNFTKSKQILYYLFNLLQITYEIKETKESGLIEGRTAGIFVKGKKIGCLGEVHPQTLKDFSIKMPASMIEISLEDIFEILVKG